MPGRFERALARMGEPALAEDRSLSFATRLTIYDDRHGAEVVRVAVGERGEVSSAYKRYGPGLANEIEGRDCALSSEEAARLRALVSAESFWSVGNRQDVMATGGASWMLEAKDADRYHVAYRWAVQDDAVGRIGRALLAACKVDEAREVVWSSWTIPHS